MSLNSPAFSADDESGPQMLEARISSPGPFKVGDRFTVTLVMQDVGGSGVRNIQFLLKDKFGRQHGAENDDKLSFFSTPSFLCSGASICEYAYVFRIDETWANNGFITLSSIRAFDMKTNGTYFYDDGSIEDLQTRKKSSNQHALSGLSLQLGTPPPTPTPTASQETTSIDLYSVVDTTMGAVDEALAAADASDAATAAAEDEITAASSFGTDLAVISTQIEKLDVALENAKVAYAIATSAFENARKQLSNSQKSVNAQSNAIGKLALSTAVVRLSNAVKILGASREKLITQVSALDAKRSFLLSAKEKLMTNTKGESASTTSVKPVKKDKTIVCLKGKSSLKVIGKNPKCPAGYKVKK